MNKVKKKFEDTKRIIKNTKEKINSLDFDAHWYRRVFHAFGACFLIYYLLPDVDWINILKLVIPPILVVIAISIEILRLTGKISSNHFFGLRMYEKNRVGSYVFFAVGILILLMLPWQAIAIPCILCACLGDPIIGEIRIRFGKSYSYILGFLICTLFFMVVWHAFDSRLVLLISVVGGLGAIIGESKQFWWIDDDFMIQILPAILLIVIWLSASHLGLNLPPDQIITPAKMPW